MNDFSQPGREEPSSRLQCVVMKFGGTSVEDAAAIRRACQLVSQRSQLRPVLVLSLIHI